MFSGYNPLNAWKGTDSILFLRIGLLENETTKLRILYVHCTYMYKNGILIIWPPSNTQICTLQDHKQCSSPTHVHVKHCNKDSLSQNFTWTWGKPNSPSSPGLTRYIFCVSWHNRLLPSMCMWLKYNTKKSWNYNTLKYDWEHGVFVLLPSQPLQLLSEIINAACVSLYVTQ